MCLLHIIYFFNTDVKQTEMHLHQDHFSFMHFGYDKRLQRAMFVQYNVHVLGSG